MNCEETRLMTYVNFPNSSVSPEDLARAGFFYLGMDDSSEFPDRVACPFCENVLRHWERGDNPAIEHRRHFPICPFVLGHDVGNVPIPPAQRQTAKVHLTEQSTFWSTFAKINSFCNRFIQLLSIFQRNLQERRARLMSSATSRQPQAANPARHSPDQVLIPIFQGIMSM